MSKKQEEMERIQETLKEKIDKKLAGLMEQFNKEKTTYETFSKQEQDINQQFADLKKKYDTYKQ